MKRKTSADKHQADEFVRVARELGCDEREGAFDDALRAIVPKVPKKPSQPTAPRQEKE